MRKSVIWIPVVMVGAMVYWTLALGFGGLSLLTFAPLFEDGGDTADSATVLPKDSYQSITVNLTGAAELEQAQAHEVAPVSVDLVAEPDFRGGDEGGQGAHGGGRSHDDQGPGQTAF